jgi:hypothetical protein
MIPFTATSRHCFADWFYSTVAIFLLLTAAFKLIGVLQESSFLAAADPLVPFLTVRQMTFSAGLIELGVAYALWRHRTAVWAPWLILWLVGLFAVYRLGLWSIDFRGHCSCLGHLFDWLPNVNAWADRLMLASLAVMAVGTLWTLLRANQREAA